MWFLEMYYSLRLTGKNERSHNYWPGYFSNQPHSAVPKEQRIPAGITPWGWLQIRYFPLGFKSAVFTNSMGKYPLKYLFNGVKTLKDNHSYKLNCLYQYVLPISKSIISFQNKQNRSYLYFHFLPPFSGVFQSYTTQEIYNMAIHW